MTYRFPAAILLAVFLSFSVSATAEARDGYPKIMNFFLSNTLTDPEIDLLARYDLLVLHNDFTYEHPQGIARIRSLNPNAVILAYIPINDTRPEFEFRPPETISHQIWAAADASDYWMYDVTGNLIVSSGGKVEMNVTPHSPVNNLGEKYWQWFARFVHETLWQEGQSQWDGIFVDNVWDKISWQNQLIPHPLDPNRDGVADSADSLDAWWRSANGAAMSRIRELLGPDVPILSNGSNSNYQALNGTMIEHFPIGGPYDQGNPYGYSWQRWMFQQVGSYFPGLANFNTHPFQSMVIQASWNGTILEPNRDANFERHKRLCLGSALLGDGYFEMDHSWFEHSALWWEPEFDYHLGDPLGPAYSVQAGNQTVWRRDYEYATVVVNPNNLSAAQTPNNPSVAGWDAYIGPPPDLVPPDPVTVIAAEPIDDGRVRLMWEAVSDDGPTGRAFRYYVRYSQSPITQGIPWTNAIEVANTLVPKAPGEAETLVVAGLIPETTYYFAVRSGDGWNFSALTHTASATTLSESPVDAVSPDAIDDLTLLSADTTSAVVTWTAPGDDGPLGTATVYLGRIANALFDQSGWDAATPVPGLPVPLVSGSAQQASLSGLLPGTSYYVAICAEDEVGNLGALGNVLAFTTDTPPPPVDAEGPSTVGNLAVVSAGTSWLAVRFTAPGDAMGTVTAYDLRYVQGAAFPPESFGAATAVTLPAPLAPGSTEQHFVTSLASSTTFAFRVRSQDSAGNWSALSSAAVGTTLTPPPPDTTGPGVVGDLAIAGADTTRMLLTFTAPADAGGIVSSYDLRYVPGPSFPMGAWAGATPAPTGAPKTPGSAESIWVEGLASGSAYSFRVASRDGSGNLSAPSLAVTGMTLTPPPVDETGPTVVGDLDIAASDTVSLLLTFTAPTDAEGTVAAYDLRYVPGLSFPAGAWDSATPVPTGLPGAPGSSEAVLVESLDPGSPYAFRLVSLDGAGNESSLSNAAADSTDAMPPAPDTQPPAIILGIAAHPEVEAIAVTWTPSSDPDVTHYRLYRSRGAASRLTLYMEQILEHYYLDRGILPGRAYAYAIVAVDGAGNAGAMSPSVRAESRPGVGSYLPEDFIGVGNPYPNPTPAGVSLQFESSFPVSVTAEVFDVTGRRVRLLESAFGTGTNAMTWDGSDEAGHRVGRGLYWMRIRSEGRTWTRKVMLEK